MAIAPDELAHLARLSHIGVSAEDVDSLCADVAGIVAHVTELNSVDTETVPPTSFAVPIDTVLRDDEPRPSWSAETVLANAPQREADFFRVQAVFE